MISADLNNSSRKDLDIQALRGIAVFLASEASNYITGTAIPVDGGYSING